MNTIALGPDSETLWSLIATRRTEWRKTVMINRQDRHPGNLGGLEMRFHELGMQNHRILQDPTN